MAPESSGSLAVLVSRSPMESYHCWREGVRYDGDLWLPASVPIEMSTVISWLATAEGFVIASDGRDTGSEGETLADNAQKIFFVDKPGVRLAYGLADTVRIGQSPDRVLFDFHQETARAAEEIAETPPKYWWAYLTALMTELTETLNRKRWAANDTLAEETQTYISIGGFYGKHLKSGHLYFRHGIATTESEPYIHPPGLQPPPFGSQKVFEALATGDARLARYSSPPRQRVLTLAQAIKRVRNDVLAHCDAEARNVDQSAPWPYGGRVQIATVTFADGCRWVAGFEPFSA